MTEPDPLVSAVGSTTPVPTDVVTGQVWFERLATAAAPSRLRVAKAHFAPGARTVWHSHQYGQVLHVLDGVALTQERGAPVERFVAGETIVCPPGVWHWHGAAADRTMIHLAVHEVQDDGTDATWGEHVTDAEYGA